MPVFGMGRIHLEIGDRIGAMSFGGIGVMRRLVSKLGLVREINQRLHLLKRHLPYSESDHVLNIAYNILCGGTRLEDLNGLRNNAPYMDGMVAQTLGEKKEGMDISYKGVWGYHPLAISLANTGEVLYVVNQPGNMPSHTGAGEWIDRLIESFGWPISAATKRTSSPSSKAAWLRCGCPSTTSSATGPNVLSSTYGVTTQVP